MATYVVDGVEDLVLEDVGEAGIVKNADGEEDVELEDAWDLFYVWYVLGDEDFELEDVGTTYLILNVEGSEQMNIKEAFTIVGTIQNNMLEGQYRVENEYLNRYEAYLGTDAWPDLTDDLVLNPPWDFFTTWPHTLPPLSPGRTYYLIIRKRDKYGLIDFNVEALVIRIGPGGDELPVGPVDPFISQLGGEPVGKVRFRASYNWMQDSLPADRWHVYLTSDGSTPDPSNPSHLYLDVPMNTFRVEDLDQASGDAWGHGTVIKVIYRTYRTSDDAESLNTDVLEHTINLDAPGIVDGELFLGGGADR